MGWLDNLGNAARHVSAAWTHEVPALDASVFDAALRALYTKERVLDTIYRDSAWLAAWKARKPETGTALRTLCDWERDSVGLRDRALVKATRRAIERMKEE